MNNTSQNKQQLFTRVEVENIIRELERAKVQEEEERYQGSELSLTILQALDETPPAQLKDNFKSYKRSIHKHNHEEWTNSEQINKEFVPGLKSGKVDAYQLIITIHKLTETTRASTEIYDQLQYLSTRTIFSSPTDPRYF